MHTIGFRRFKDFLERENLLRRFSECACSKAHQGRRQQAHEQSCMVHKDGKLKNMKSPVGVVQNRIRIPEIPKEADYWELFQLSLNAWLRILGISPDRENLKSFIKCAALCEPRGKGRENFGMTLKFMRSQIFRMFAKKRIKLPSYALFP